MAVASDSLRRLEDLDRRYLRQNLFVAFLNIPVSALFAARYGWWLVFFSAIPAASAVVGLAWLRSSIGLVGWHVVHLVLLAVSIAGSTLTTGGTESPVLHAIPFVGLIWVTYFPERTASLIAAPLTALVVIVLDPATSNLLTVVISLGNSLLIPLFALRLVESELRHRRQAVVDELTGCLNRHAFSARRAELAAQLDRGGGPVGVVAFDIDHFKRVNDTLGHAAGDRALVGLVDRVRKRLRGFELLYRVGGEEFVLLLPGATLSDATTIAETVRSAASADNVGDLPITVSCGIAVADAGTPLDAALVQADIALYRAKSSGRDRCVVATR